MSDYYRQSYVFERMNESVAIRYVCYENLRTGQFAVSGGDILRAPESAETLSFQAVKEVEVFMERVPDVWFDTLQEALDDAAPMFDKERQA